MGQVSSSRPGERVALSRRRMLGLSTMAMGLAAAGVAGCSPGGGGTPASDASTSPVTAPQPIGVLGADVDQNLDTTNFDELRAVSATWLRGFYNVQLADQDDVAGQSGMRKLMAAASNGYGTVLSLKFNYTQGLPAAGSSAMKIALERLDKVLAVIMGKVDIVTVGNEPFLECGKQFSNINEFYETVAQRTIDYRQRVGSGNKTQIYMGALNDLENPGSRTPHTDRWLEFVKKNPSIAGTDCHPHVASVSDGQLYLDYILPRIRADQKILATEFSLVKLYKAHLTDPIPAGFADRYGIPRGTPVWQVAHDAIERPFPQIKWNDFLTSCPWFADNKGFMSDLVNRFRTTGRLAVACYPLAQGIPMTRDFGPNKPPWIFTSIFCRHTVQRGTDGLPGENEMWSNEFRALQHS